MQDMKEEVDTLESNDTWELCELPKGKKIFYSKWVYKTKYKGDGRIQRYKARLVVKGFTYQYDVDFGRYLHWLQDKELEFIGPKFLRNKKISALFGCKQKLDSPKPRYKECVSQWVYL